ncbi:hypothetical protein [Nitrosopumilus sp.]|uniref:hypothetical protein n=1 Tax=Nitrosopumilus sp. TaxID=2024843 RepID=UPI0026292836|nr:hypothetical protein [Nitrosopumilus sp.]
MQFVIIVVMIFSVGVVPLLASSAYAASEISSAVADDPDDGDAAYSVGDTIVITFPAQANSTFASGIIFQSHQVF